MSVTAPGGTFELAGRTVARIGFGAMQLPGVGDRPAPPRDVAISVRGPYLNFPAKFRSNRARTLA